MTHSTECHCDNSKRPHIVLVDNHDSFVYNLVDAFAVANYPCTVFRNDVPVEEILAAHPDLLVLSPGPGHPVEAGNMMAVIERCLGQIPILGICLGFQALLSHFGGEVAPCGPVHGTMDTMTLTPEGLASSVFQGLTVDARPENDFTGTQVPIARYHSLGCLSDSAPSELVPLATCNAATGKVVMAAKTSDNSAIGLQFHPESILSPKGPVILDRCIDALLNTH